MGDKDTTKRYQKVTRGTVKAERNFVLPFLVFSPEMLQIGVTLTKGSVFRGAFHCLFNPL